MKKLPVVRYAQSLPSRLMTAAQLSSELEKRGIEIRPERITELADSYYLPHYRVEAGPPLFVLAEARKWVAENLTQRFEGNTLPAEFRVLVDAVPFAGGAPTALQQIADRLIVQAEICTVPGIYFLCRGEKIIYVGQSMCTGPRIATHRLNGRVFDRSYILPVPPSQLDAIEGAFIRAMRPEENVTIPTEYHPDVDVLASVGITGDEKRTVQNG